MEIVEPSGHPCPGAPRGPPARGGGGGGGGGGAPPPPRCPGGAPPRFDADGPVR